MLSLRIPPDQQIQSKRPQGVRDNAVAGIASRFPLQIYNVNFLAMSSPLGQPQGVHDNGVGDYASRFCFIFYLHAPVIFTIHYVA